MEDPVVAEVRAIREAYGAKFGFDLAAIYRDLKEFEAKSGWPIVSFPPRPVVPEAPLVKPIAEESPVICTPSELLANAVSK